MPKIIKTDLKEEAKSSSKMQELLTKYKIQLPEVGETVTGKIISISNSEIHVDINGITTGVIRGYELEDESGEYANLKLGGEVTAIVVEEENENGEMELSLREASHKKAWENLKKIMTEGKIVEVEITNANRGGLLVKLGKIVGFLPVSQLTPEHYPRVEGGDRNRILEILNSYLGQKMKVKLIDASEPEAKLIVSEKAAWEETQKDVIGSYKVGDVIEGKVTGVVDFGAFVEFGNGLEGLIHISELGWQRIDNPRDFIKVGQRVKTKIIEIEGSKISLSSKKITKDPWVEATKKYKIGQVVKGEVLKINPFGIFVKLDNEIHGLAHISQLTDKPIASPGDVIKLGGVYNFRIISIEPKDHRLGLSLKAARKPEPVKPKAQPEKATKEKLQTQKEPEKVVAGKSELETEVKTKTEAKLVTKEKPSLSPGIGSEGIKTSDQSEKAEKRVDSLKIKDKATEKKPAGKKAKSAKKLTKKLKKA